MLLFFFERTYKSDCSVYNKKDAYDYDYDLKGVSESKHQTDNYREYRENEFKNVDLLLLHIAFAMVVGVLMVGVWAVKNTNFTLGGNISFTTTGVNATISAGTLSSTAVWQDDSVASSKMKEVVINTNKTESQLQSEFASWQGINLYFNETAQNITISFRITNNSTVADEYLSVGVGIDATDMKNATASVNTMNAIIDPNNDYEDFVVTFSVTEKDTNASIENFNINFSLEYAQPKTLTELTEEGYEFVDATISGTKAIKNYTGTAEALTLPALYKDGNTIYRVTEVGTGNSFMDDSTGQTKWGPFEGSNCTVTSVVIPNTYKTIKSMAFQNNLNLTSITFSTGLETIASGAFSYTSVKFVEFPAGMTEINGFSDCGSLSNVKIPYGVETVAGFSGCSALKSVDLPSSVKTIGSMAFNNSGITSIELPEGLETIEQNAFSWTQLKNIVIPDSVTTMGTDVFDSSALTSITFGKGLTEIPALTFAGCPLTSITIPDHITLIGDDAFQYCTQLSTINIPKSVTSFGQRTFSNISSTATINYAGSQTEWNAIENLSNAGIPSGATIKYDQVFA